MNIKKILVPIDFSEISLNALRYAADFAQSNGAAIFLLHIADPDSLLNDLKGNLSPEHLLSLVKEERFLTGIKTTSILKKGKIADLILEESRTNDVDLVVMGTQGAGNLTRTLIGTNTTKVVSHSKCPVLAIPGDATWQPVKKVVLAVDLEHRADKSILDVVNTMKKREAAILAVYVGTSNDRKNEAELNRYVEELKIKSQYQKIVAKYIHSELFLGSLENFILDIEADMLVMITHHRGVFESIFDPSVTKRLAFHTQVPLMVIPEIKHPVFFFT